MSARLSLFARVISGRLYTRLRVGGKKALQQMPPVRELVRRSEEHVKGMVVPGTLFEELGLQLHRPDRRARPARAGARAAHPETLRGPQLLHVVTRKGKGYAPAEADPIMYHGPDLRSGQRHVKESAASRPTRRFSATGCATWPSATSGSSASPRRCAKAPAWSNSRKRFPERYFDVASPSSMP